MDGRMQELAVSANFVRLRRPGVWMVILWVIPVAVLDDGLRDERGVYFGFEALSKGQIV